MEAILTAIPGLELRWAQEEDIPLILEYIRELAEFEKMTDDVVATEAGLVESLFGPSPAAEVVLGHPQLTERLRPARRQSRPVVFVEPQADYWLPLKLD